MNDTTRAYLDLHIAVLLFGFTAILGELIDLPAITIVWWRVLLTVISMLFLLKVGRLFREMPLRSVLRFAGIGILTGVHWVTFYGAIKLSNASITLVCLATTTFFTSFLEPLILGRKYRWYEGFIGVMIIPGMALIVNTTPASFNAGILVGLSSAFLASLFSTLNKKYINEASPLSISFLELGAATIFLSLVMPFFQLTTDKTWIPTMSDWIYLIILALLCTTLAYVLAVRALKHISAFASTLTINLEPVYGIVMAWLILKEHKELSAGFYIGVAIILVAVFTYPIMRKRFEKSQ